MIVSVLFFAGPAPFEAVLKSAPDIIREASKSQLGILALMLLILGALAYVFFRRASSGIRLAVYAALLVGAALYAFAIGSVPKKKIKYFSHVLDAATSKPVVSAKVALDVSGAPFITYTDSEGSYVLSVSDPTSMDDLRVDKDGYEHFDRHLAGDPTLIPAEVRLQPVVNEETTPPEPKPIKHTATGKTEKKPPTCDPVEVRSNPQPSGYGKGWSGWYDVHVGHAPSGCTMSEVTFWLTGDRQCGAWSECREITRSDLGVEYQFRLQGHEEDPPPRMSEGHLRVVYKPK